MSIFLPLTATSLISTAASVQYQHQHSLIKKRIRKHAPVQYQRQYCSMTYTAPTPEKVKVNVMHRELTLGEKMRFGVFEGEELVYKERFVVRSSQVGANKTATIETIARLLQETSCNHSQRLGCSIDGFPTPPIMRKNRLIWVTSRVYIEMYKYPAWGDVVEIEHWWEPDGKIAARFDYMITNLSTGELIGRVTSKYLMMNQDTRKLQKISGEVREEFLALCIKSPRSAFPEENNGSLKKIPQLKGPADCSQFNLTPRRADMDMNKHVNNVTYYSWLLQVFEKITQHITLLQSIPQDIVETHELQAITIEFRNECQYNDSVDSLASIEIQENSEYQCQFIHLLKFSGTHQETNRGRTVWRQLESIEGKIS